MYLPLPLLCSPFRTYPTLHPVVFVKAEDRSVSSVGRPSDYGAEGLGFELQTGPTLRVLKQMRRIFAMTSANC